jgi:hypothetical protein
MQLITSLINPKAWVDRHLNELFSEFSFLMKGLMLLSTSLICSHLSAQQFINVASDYQVSALPQSINFGSGLSFYDFNNDGLDDLSFTMTADSCRFYLNTGDGFELLPSFMYADGESKCLLWADYDNDGDLDILLTVNEGRHKLYNNDGDFNFTDVSIESGLVLENERYYGASFADYDSDGFLDFYVCVYAIGPGPLPFFSTNRLYHNNGDGTFEDVTSAAGVNDGIRFSFQSVWFDFDLDGLIDLFVINDRLNANSLYKNNGDGTFADVSSAAGIQFAGQDPMTASVADFDHDGDLDIYLTNTGVNVKVPKLLVNNGDGTFTDEGLSYNVVFQHWSWGAVWVDFENNGSQDLYVTTANPSPLATPVQNFSFLNTGSAPYPAATALFEGNPAATSFAVARGDINNDGHYDIVVLNRNPYDIFLWENQGTDNNYIKITLHGTKSNSYAIGSWIKVYAGGQQYTQFTMCGENYLSQNSQHHIFGLGSLMEADSVAVEYPSGHIDVYYELAPNTHYHFTEGDTYLVDIEASSALELCAGDSVTLNAGVHEHYLWSTGDTTAQITTTVSGTFLVQTTNSFGVSSFDSVEVVINPNPSILASIENAKCAGSEDGTIELQNMTGIPSSIVSWSNEMQGESIEGIAAGDYLYSFIDVNGCITEGMVTVTEPLPLQLFLFTENETLGNDGSLLIIVSGGVSPYFTTVNGNLLVGGLLENLSEGTYLIQSIDANFCIISDTVDIEGLVSANSIESNNRFNLYPNPSLGNMVLELSSAQKDITISILTLEGKELIRKKYQNTSSVAFEVDLASGSYLLAVECDEFKGYTRFVLMQ